MEPLHPIQREIMRRMTLLPNARYSDLKPEDVDGNLFMYHLNQLIGDGYVEKQEKRYVLPVRGKRYASLVSVDSGLIRLQPKIVVMLDARNDEGEQLLFRWKRQPFYGTVSLPYGKTWFGHSILEMAQRELAMKTSLRGTLTHRGDLYVKTVFGDEIISHMLVHMICVTDTQGSPRSTVPTGECFWGHWRNLDKAELAPGLAQICAVVDSGVAFQEIIAEM